jgi:putative PEP-CTERM system histidine kinase
MLIYPLYALNVIVLLSNFLLFRLENNERRLSLSLVQSLLILPVMVGFYIYLGFDLKPQFVPLLLFTEIVFALTLFYMAFRLDRGTVKSKPESHISVWIQIFMGFAVIGLSVYFVIYVPPVRLSDSYLLFKFYGSIYLCSLILLISVLVVAWYLERFWRALDPPRRWQYKFFIVGGYIVCGAIGWAASYRVTYLLLSPRHFRLLAALLLLGWFLISYASARHRLLNRKIFISRKVVYSFVAPTIFAVYFIVLGIVSLIMRNFELPLPFVLQWLLIALGLAAACLFVFSGNLRRQVHYFISTHFYVNKYEYRDEWLALSNQLQGALSETDVVNAMHQVLKKSLYTTNLTMWLGDAVHGYKPVYHNANPGSITNDLALTPDDPLITFFQDHPYFHAQETNPDAAWTTLWNSKRDFLVNFNLVLIAPLLAGDQLVGLIGLGPEFSGGRYGHDDFDLLTAIGTQSASALTAVRMANKLAEVRERRAWDKLSAFVLHDVKNAANMLSLARENAQDHIQNSQFQQDFLESVDDALERMNKVQDRLGMLKMEVIPKWEIVDLRRFLEDLCGQLKKKLKVISVVFNCRTSIRLKTDPMLLSRIVENLLLNSLEAGGEGTRISIDMSTDEDQGQAVIEILDSGPGIAAHLLPDALFAPYQTTKSGGSGIGLWQVKRLMESLNGTVAASNVVGGGARFILELPCEDVKI